MNPSKCTITVAECKPLPKLWDNDEKMTAWFAPFRNRDLNPLNYDNKMAFWKNNIEYFCTHTNEICFTLTRIRSFFVRNGKLPVCLSTVFESLVEDGSIVKLTEYENSLSNDTWSSWAVNKFINAPFKWSYGMLSSNVIGKKSIEIDENVEYIHIASLHTQSEKMRKFILDKVGESLITHEDIQKTLSETHQMICDMKTIKLMVKSLQSRSMADVVFNMHLNTHLVKFSSDLSSAPRINQQEVSVLVLQTKETLLCNELQILESQKKDLETEVKKLLLNKMKTMAKNTLRKKKELEKRIDKLVNVLENIQHLLYKVQDTETDSKILNTYQVGARALKSGLTGNDLNMKAVDDTMSEIQEIFDMHSDIQETLGQAVGSQMNENELEDELSELLLNGIPSVPTTPLAPRPRNEDFSLDDLPNVPEVNRVSKHVLSTR